MAMGSQFSLSLELTKLVPFGSLVNAAGHGLVRLLREIQASGSDFITEQDLAEIFGRNRVEPLFESTFRTAVKHSVVHQISGIAELIIEGGAGPTVRRSLHEPAYFAMVVQLSLLTYTHELKSLTSGLTRSFEQRTQGSAEYVSPPRYDALKGVLRAIREQTCGFMWELIISAVEKRLYPSIAWTDGSLYTIRTIPQIILQALLDSFTAIQHLPEHTRLRIRSSTGIPTIIVWAHHVLGLSVKVDINEESLLFGSGPVTVYIDNDNPGPPMVALLNETDDPFFQLVEQQEVPILTPVRRHPIRDYGTRAIRLRENDRDRERSMVLNIVTKCLEEAREQEESRKKGLPEPGQLSCFPSTKRVLSTAKLLFASNEDILNDNLLETRIADSISQDMPKQYNPANKLMQSLFHVVLALCMAEGLDEDLSLFLDSLEGNTSQLIASDARTAFSALALLLQGSPPRSPRSSRLPQTPLGASDVAVVSAWGWSLCVGSITCRDPSDAKPELNFVRGVPARGGERRYYILDGSRSMKKEVLSKAIDTHEMNMQSVSGPGQQYTLGSWTRPNDTRHFIGITDDAFEVAHIFSCRSSGELNKATIPYSITCGLRSMQEASWTAYHTPTCEHPVSLGQSMTVPDGVWVFNGCEPPFEKDVPKNAVLAGSVAGDPSARWILIAHMLYRWRPAAPLKQKVCVRSRECCFGCAVRFAKSCHVDSPVGLVL
ncbi:MAG: hypothetical protein Q9216_003120 [Gyalolechia sp. 2 TL-2023]